METFGPVFMSAGFGLGNAVIALAMWRVVFGFFPVEHPTKWTLWCSLGMSLLSIVSMFYSISFNLLQVAVYAIVNLGAILICWYLWVVRAQREGRYFG